jgi:hypothetical protein
VEGVGGISVGFICAGYVLGYRRLKAKYPEWLRLVGRKKSGADFFRYDGYRVEGYRVELNKPNKPNKLNKPNL